MRRFAMPAVCAALAACQQAPAPTTNDAAPADVAASPRPEAAAASDAAARQSVFTPLDETACSLIEENRDEGPYWRRACPGAGGYSVEWTESDLRQGLEVIDAHGGRTDLDLSAIAAKGAFNRLGPRIEWRGGRSTSPDALIVRVFVADPSRPEAADRSVLAVARLAPKPCLVAIVEPSAPQNGQARAAADTPGPCPEV